MTVIQSGQRFSGNATQTNIASMTTQRSGGGGGGGGKRSRVVVVESTRSAGNPFGSSSTKVNGFLVDPRYRNYSMMDSSNNGCRLDGLACVKKEINGRTMWTLDGVVGAPTPEREVSISDTSDSSDSSSSSSSSTDSEELRERLRRKHARRGSAKRAHK